MSGGGAAGAGGGGPLFSPDDLACPICVETIEDAFATPCGHTFCFKCISTHLKNKSTCPSCGAHLVQDQIHPNFLLNKLIQRAATLQQTQSLKTALLQHVQHDLAAAGPSIGLQELDAAIQLLQDKRQQVATHESSNKLQLLMLFLQHAKARQLGQLSDLEQQLEVLQQDLATARAAAATAAASPQGSPQQQQREQQPQQQPEQQHNHVSAHLEQQQAEQQDPHWQQQADQSAAAAPDIVGSRPHTPQSLQQPSQQQQQPQGAADSPHQAATGASQLGGRGSAFKRLQPLSPQQPVQQPLQQQPQQQQQQGFRPLPRPQASPAQHGFRLLPKPQQQQQQQQLPLLQPASSPQQGFRPLPKAQQVEQAHQQQQQQQQLPLLQPASSPQQGFRPLPKAQQVERAQQQQQQQQPQPSAAPAVQRGFRPFTQQQEPAATVRPRSLAGPAGTSGARAPGFRPYTAQQGSGAAQLHGHAADAGQAKMEVDRSAAVAAAAAAASEAAAPDGAGSNLVQQQQQQQGRQQQGFRPLLQPEQQQQPPQQQQQQGFRPLPPAQGSAELNLNPEKKRKILAQFDELQQAYLSSRMRRSSGSVAAAAGGPEAAAAAAGDGVNGLQQQQWRVSGSAGGAGDVGNQGASSKLQPEHRAEQLPTANGQHVAQAAAAAGRGGAEQMQQSGSSLQAAAAAAGGGGGAAGEEVLDAFSRMLYAVTHYNRLQPLACIPPPGASRAGGGGGAQILSSVDFDCAGQLFATAGVQQRIFVHDFQSVLKDGGPHQKQSAPAAAAGNSSAAGPDIAGGASGGGGGGDGSSSLCAPRLDLATGSKISCVSFSPAVQQYLLSSDYTGVVQLWDLTGGRSVRQWEAHDKRIWAVDFCPLDATTFATGSDDGTVKVWGLCEAPAPRLTLPVRANVCSIKFSPAAPHMLAAGNAGHQVHLFDLRSPRAPLAVLKGHSKAVSYVRWAGPDTLVTASTDSTLRLWTASGGRGSSDTGAGQNPQQAAAAAAGLGGGANGAHGSSWDCEEGGWHCSQVFKGHSNSKHFVGLATQGPFIACGSETNEVFIYHQGLAQPSLKCLLKPWDDAASSSGGGQEGSAGLTGAAAAAGGEGGGAAAVAAAGAAAAASTTAAAKSPFVSALCWKKDSDVLVAANSKGGVWVLAMQ